MKKIIDLEKEPTMKTNIKLFASVLALMLIVAGALAQPNNNAGFTYQGQIAVQSGSPAVFSTAVFGLYTDPSNSTPILSPVTNTISVGSNGVFTTVINFGSFTFSNPPYYLEIDLATNSGGPFTTLTPRQLLTGTPQANYALNAGTAASYSGTVLVSQLSGQINNGQLANNSVTVNAGSGLSGGGPATLGGSVTLNNAGVTSLAGGGGVTVSQGTGPVTLGSSPITLNAGTGLSGGGPVSLGGSTSLSLGVVPSASLSGTYSSVLNFNNSGNSFSGNGSGLTGVNATSLSGYGYCSLPCYWWLTGNAGTAPGTDFVGTTDNNRLEFHVNSTRALVLYPDQQGNNSANLVGGFAFNLVDSSGSGDVIAGGGSSGNINVISNSWFAAISGGDGNQIYFGNYATIGGGYRNYVNSFGATVGGGTNNTAGYFATVAGGAGNTASTYAAVGGGQANFANGNWAYIGGGSQNSAIGANSTVSGGFENTVSGPYSVAGGGASNTVSGAQATVAGGWSNVALFAYATVGGGHQNVAAGGNAATVSGGEYNQAIGDHPAVGGGYFNTANGVQTTVGGGFGNIASNSYATVSGGANNVATNQYATVGGGHQNRVGGGNAPTVSGGEDNQAIGDHPMVGGGFQNTANGTQATVGGGYQNQATNSYGTVPGGIQNIAGGAYSFAAGDQAQAVNQGAFVWADSSGTAFASTNNNSFNIRAAGGFDFYSTSSGRSGSGVFLAAGASSWASVSDRNAKKNIRPIDGRSVLEKLADVPIAQWNYKWEDDSEVPNIGPMAQDFKAAFYPGRDDKSITTMEFDGVALAAIQGLNQKLEEQVKDKDARIQSLEARLERLENLVSNPATSHGDAAK